MRGRIKESYWVITKISLSPSDNSREVLTNMFDLTSNDNVANASVHDDYCSVN